MRRHILVAGVAGALLTSGPAGVSGPGAVADDTTDYGFDARVVACLADRRPAAEQPRSPPTTRPHPVATGWGLSRPGP